MSLPGDQIPEEALPPGGSNLPARDAEFPPVWCRHGVEWAYDGDVGGWVCLDDGHHDHDEAYKQVGAIPVEHQPTFANPPNEAQLIALTAEDIQAEAEACQEHVRRLLP